jgi:hypothetical protein
MRKDGMRKDEPIAASPAPRTAAEYRIAIEALLAEMEWMGEPSKQTRAEMERLKGESAALRAATERIKARIDRRLDALATLL